ncbi:hypothetical protein OC846_001612 [Tilletia horrida]|uniref:Amine oxidase domain-containing protein n=1 Tax=Tilletia horrida TaxID=155126 RepID=A0AAN6JSU6_9BASI|nr:hypothetical protein OC846_001612 [Tilletia horrida]KAK0568548.1 hypothetical protein OC861_001796 [Tilletia horrida]
MPVTHDQSGQRQVRIAVIGSGLTGLAAAHFLSLELRNVKDATLNPPQITVHLFERAPRLGMDASSISVSDPVSKKTLRIDVPMRAFNAGFYPELLTLYRHLNIPGRLSNFTFSFAKAARSLSQKHSNKVKPAQSSSEFVPSPTFIYMGSSGAKGTRIPTLVKRALTPSQIFNTGQVWSSTVAAFSFCSIFLTYLLGFAHFIVLALYHSWLGHTRDPNHPLATVTLADWARVNWVSTHFLEDILIPILSATQTSRDVAIRQTPCAEVLEFSALMFGSDSFTPGTGVHAVAKALTSTLRPDQLHLNSNIVKIQPSPTKPGAVLLKVKATEATSADLDMDAVREMDGYDYVILALQANQSAKILRDYESTLATNVSSTFKDEHQRHRQHVKQVVSQLEEFTYERNVVINHTDTRLLPPAGDRCDLNMISPLPPSASNQSWTGASLSSQDDDDDEDAVDRLLRDGKGSKSAGRQNGHNHQNGAATANGDSAPASYDPSLVAPEGCTMITHLIEQETRPVVNASTANDVIDAHGQPRLNGSTNGSADSEGDGVLFMQTTNPMAPFLPRPERILSISHFQRIVLTLRGKAAQGHFFKWTKSSPSSLSSSVARQESKSDVKSGLSTITHFPRALFQPPRSQWKVALGDLQTEEAGPVLDGASEANGSRSGSGPGLFVAGSWGPPAIPLLEGCVISARLVVSEILRREGMMSPLCEELAANQM